MRRDFARQKQKERPPVSELAMTLWVLAGLLGALLAPFWFFRHIYGG